MIALWLAAAAVAGVLQGSVHDEGGAPLANATVVAYDARLNFANVTTGSEGQFVFTNLPDGPYRIRVIPYAQDDVVEEWADDTLLVCEADVFVADSAATEPPVVDVVLGPGASVRGVLHDADGLPVPGALVSAKVVDAPTGFLRADATDSTGEFVIRGLPTWPEGIAGYRLEVDADGWPVQNVGGGYLPTNAPTWEVSVGERLDVGVAALSSGITVSGTATGPSGEALSGEVRVYSGTQVVAGAVAGGVWAVDGLPPGQVLPWVRATGYATTWWPDVDRPGDRIAILDEGAVRDDVDLVLPLQSRLYGRLRGNRGTGGIGVLAYNDDQSVGVGAVANDLGEFVVERLHGGSYTLFVFGAGEGFLDDFARGPGGAPLVFEVPDQADTATIDVYIDQSASLSGTVHDAVTGLPVYGASVHAEGQESGVVKVVSSARDGTWAMDGLPPDAWVVWADYEAYCSADAGWAPIHHPDRVNPALVEVIQLAAADAATWDVLLPPDDDHDAMDDAWEEEHGLDPTRDDSLEDPDDDGFANIEEYILGTDPSEVVEVEEGCAGCSGGQSLLPFAILPWWRRRRVR